MDTLPELSHFERKPVIPKSCFVAPSAELMGHVTLGENSSVFYQSVLRADINEIRIGKSTNLQDGVIVHLSSELPSIVGNYVTVGHRATIHACTIGDECLIGMGAIIMDGASMGTRCLIAAGAIVLPGTQVPDGSLVAGGPASIKRTLTTEEQEKLKSWALKYEKVAAAHQTRLQP